MSNPSKPDSRKSVRRRLGRWLLVLGVVGGLIWWQRHTVIGRPLQWLVRSSLQEHDLAAAMTWANRARQGLPDDPDLALLRAGVARRMGRMKLVQQDLESAKSLGADPEDLQREQWLALAQTGQMQKAEPFLGELLRRAERSDEVCEAYVLGYIRANRTEAALTLLEAWIADDDQNAKAYLMKGQVLKLLSNFAAAEEQFRQAVKLDQDWPLPQLELAELLVERNRFDEARPVLESLSTSEADVSSMVRRNVALADCYMAEGQTEDAIRLLQSAHQRQPQSLEPAVVLGRALIESGQYEAALEPLLAALQIRPGYDETHYLLSQAYAFAGDRESAAKHSKFVEEARAELQELDELNADLLEEPGDVEKLVRAGEIQLKYGDPREGVIRILAGLDLEPNHRDGLRLLMNYYEDLANTDPAYEPMAARFAEQLQRLEVDDPNAQRPPAE